MKVREVACKTALSPSNLPGLAYALNPYRGCAIGCVYCYAPSVLHEERTWGRFVDVKRNAPAVLAKELKRARPGVVGLGTVTDGYQPMEMRFRISRYCLEQLVRFQFPVSVQTKSSLVVQDLPLLSRLQDVEIGMTITTLDESARRRFEPFSSPTERRLWALRQANDAGVRTWAFVGPILPSVTEPRLEELLRSVGDAGTKRVLYDRLRFRPGIWERVEPAVRETGLRDVYERARTDASLGDSLESHVAEVGKALGLTMEAAFPGGW